MHVALRHEARHPGTDRQIAPGAVARMMNEEIPHALRDDLRVLRRLLRGIALRQGRHGASFPTADEVATAPIGCADDA